MQIRNFKYRIIAGALVLSLLSIGVAPAMASCEGACTCSKESVSPPKHSDLLSVTLHRAHEHMHIVKLTRQNHNNESSLRAYSPGMGCHHKGIVSATCEMEPLRPLEALQNSSPSVPRVERSLLSASAQAFLEIPLNRHLCFGLPIGHLMVLGEAPIPLYLENLTLLC
jgi:hypothetical protein